MAEKRQAAGAADPRETEIEDVALRFLAGYDLESDVGRFRAYRDAIAWAEQHLLEHPFCNLFLDRVGRAVGREPAYLDNLRLRVPLPGGARLDFCFEEEWGFVVTGNEAGLGYLEALVRELRQAPCQLDHVHLASEEAPLGTRSYPLTVCKEPDDWFRRLEAGEEPEPGDEPPPREVSAEEVFALQFVQFPPPELPLSAHRLYRVRSAEALPSTDSGSRRFRFVVVGDTRRPVTIDLHLDDPGVNFFNSKELMRVVLGEAAPPA